MTERVNKFSIAPSPEVAETKTEEVKMLQAKVKTFDNDNFQEWMVYVQQSGEWKDSLPMETTFTFPADKKDDVIKSDEGTWLCFPRLNF
jgi:hypothetical protein